MRHPPLDRLRPVRQRLVRQRADVRQDRLREGRGLLDINIDSRVGLHAREGAPIGGRTQSPGENARGRLDQLLATLVRETLDEAVTLHVGEAGHLLPNVCHHIEGIAGGSSLGVV